MSILSKTKRESYKKILRAEFKELSEEKYDELLNYLYDLAKWEINVLKKEHDKS